MAPRAIPHDAEAERAALGAALYSPEAAVLVAGGLDPEAVFEPNNRKSLEAVRSLLERGAPVDPVVLAAELESRGVENPRPYVFGLYHDTPGTLSSARESVAIVRDRARRRRGIAIAADLERVCSNGADLERVGRLGEELRAMAAGIEGERPDRSLVVRIADVDAERVSWLWPGRIPRGKLTVLDGDPGLGKSTVTLDLAARLSTGSPMPDGERLEGSSGVLILTAEDGIADTVRPCLDAAGADPARVHVYRAEGDDDGSVRLPEIPRDLDAIERVVAREAVALVVVDPLMAFLSGRVDSARDQDVRRALFMLSEIASRTDAAFVVVRHLNKSGGSNALYRGGGSIGIIGAARAGLLVARDPADENRRVLAMSKSNLAPEAASLAYRLVSDELLGVARVVWEGRTEHRAADLLSVPRDDEERTALEEAADALEEMLSEGPMRARDAERALKEALGVSERTVRRARERIGVVLERRGEEGKRGGGSWWWRFPERLPGHESGATKTVATKTPDGSPRSEADLEADDGLGGQGGQPQAPWPPKPQTDEPEPDPVEYVRDTFDAEVVAEIPHEEAGG
jgi:hypothetical protein